MSRNATEMANQLAGNQAGMAELRSRLLFVLFALLVYRVGTHIPVPGIDPSQLAALFNQGQGGVLELINMFSGGALQRLCGVRQARGRAYRAGDRRQHFGELRVRRLGDVNGIAVADQEVARGEDPIGLGQVEHVD